MIFEFDSALVEAAVLAAARRRPVADFEAERIAAYEVRDREARELVFAELHGRWFRAWGLDAPIRAALAEDPRLAVGIASAAVGRAASARDEGVELFVRAMPAPEAAAGRRLVLRLRPETLLDPEVARALLRRELLHVSDMLDPEFDYEPQLPPSPAGAAQQRLARDRYAAAWGATVTGRLVRLGHLPTAARGEALDRFARAFPMLGDSTEAAFDRFFQRRPTHPEIARWAIEPAAAAGAPGPRRGARCALCAMPAVHLEVIEDPRALAAVSEDFPGFGATSVVCGRCVELYRLRAATAAAGRLTG